MQIVEQKYIPKSNNQGLRASIVECPMFPRSKQQKRLSTCAFCDFKVKINFNTVHCGYK